MHKLSVIIITKNEAENIGYCLESIKWADEIIVLDSGSTDNTVAICREYTEKIFITDWPGFGLQKNRALAKATHDWVLSIDADEVISPELAIEIQNIISHSSAVISTKKQNISACVAYELPRSSFYCGRKIRFGDWRNDTVIRLFRRTAGKFTDVLVHEKLVINGKIGKLMHPLLHYSFKDLGQVLAKMNSYSTAGALLRFERGKKINILKTIGKSFWTFSRGYILKAGFIDGREGFLLAISNALGTFYTYTKLMYLQRSSPTISIIITTYNRPDALEKILLALNQQTVLPTEVIIADDGSTATTKDLVAKLRAQLRYPLIYIWQPDNGFQAAKIRNKAAAQACGEYLIFLDGDCIPLPDFVAQQRALAEPGWFVAGNRILLNQQFTNELLQSSKIIGEFTFGKWLNLYVTKKCNRLFPLINLPLGKLRKIFRSKWQGVKSCNLAIWKKEFIQINGFDEAFVGWGYEDSDLIIRLLRQGIKRKSGKFAIPVIHLWHSENDRSNEVANRARLAQIATSTSKRAEQGIDQYL